MLQRRCLLLFVVDQDRKGVIEVFQVTVVILQGDAHICWRDRQTVNGDFALWITANACLTFINMEYVYHTTFKGKG